MNGCRLLAVIAAVMAAGWAAAQAPASPGAELAATATPTDVAAAGIGDDVLAADVRRSFEPFESLARVTVEVEAGAVRLGGEVSTLQAWRLAEEVAGRAEGANAVVNEIEIAADVRGQVDALRETLAQAANFAPVVVFALVVLAFFLFLGWLVGRWSAPFERFSPNRFVQEVAQTAVRAGLALAGVVLALHIVDATAIAGALIGTAGVAGIAIGFAFKDLIENHMASVLLSLRQPFAPNDHVDIDGFEGIVVRLTSRATILMTLDGNHVRIPNARVFKGVIVNYTRNPRRRFDFVLGLAAESDLSAAQTVGESVLRRIPGVLDDPAPWSQVEGVGDSNVPIRFYGWVDQRDINFPRASSEAIRLVKEGLEAAGFELPEPIYRIRSETSPKEPAERREAGVSVELRADIAEHGDPIVGQIEEERRAVETSDLLDPTAPQE
ncbi:MAG TPA: mechanosensitive ion channel family protein [Methylomirabilota bacterium]|nr:mechanosensitive ion channel family protein [Methylomirabilota bacterium]